MTLDNRKKLIPFAWHDLCLTLLTLTSPGPTVSVLKSCPQIKVSFTQLKSCDHTLGKLYHYTTVAVMAHIFYSKEEF